MRLAKGFFLFFLPRNEFIIAAVRQPAAVARSSGRSSQSLLRHSKHILNTSHCNYCYHILSNCHTAALPHCHAATPPHFHTVTLPFSHSITLPQCHMVKLPHCQTTTSSHCSTDTLSHYRTAALSHYHNVTFFFAKTTSLTHGTKPKGGA